MILAAITFLLIGLITGYPLGRYIERKSWYKYKTMPMAPQRYYLPSMDDRSVQVTGYNWNETIIHYCVRNLDNQVIHFEANTDWFLVNAKLALD